MPLRKQQAVNLKERIKTGLTLKGNTWYFVCGGNRLENALRIELFSALIINSRWYVNFVSRKSDARSRLFIKKQTSGTFSDNE